MSFLAPWMLFGIAAVGIPIALHFFYKARHRPLPWAAMEFLRQSIEQTSRRLRFQELVLLILRCLVLLLLALALARLSCRWGASTGRGETVDAVLVFDTSYSMGARDGDRTRLEHAQAAALGVIDNLPNRSTVQVVACSDRATAIKFTPTNFDQARQVVKGLTLTSLAGDMLPGLNEAHAALDRGVGSNKEIYVFSDMQKNGWERQAAAVKAKAAELRPRAPLILVRCGNESVVPANVAITDITMPGGIPHTGARVPFTVLLKNTGKKPVANVAVTLEVDGEKQELDTGFAPLIEPGTTFPVTLTGMFTQPGARMLTAKLGERKTAVGESTAAQPDQMPGDNRFDKLIPVRDRIRVLLVDGSLDSGDAAKSATFYVRNALLPTTESARENYFVKVSEVKPELLSPALLGDADICVLGNVSSSSADRPGIPGLPPDFADRLVEFVKAGGGLVIGAGDFVAPDKYNAVLGTRGLLPFPLDAADATTPDKPHHPATDSAENPSFLSQLRESPLSITTAEVDVFRTIGTREADRAGGGRVLLRLDNNRPLITAKALGDGEVIFITTSLDETWTNWPAISSSFLPVMQRLLSHLTGRATNGTNRVAGESLQWAPPKAAKGFELIRPDRTRMPLGTASGGDKAFLNVTATETPLAGEYQMAFEGEATPSGPRFAVIPDLRESENLEAMTDAEFEQAVGFRPVIVAANAEAQKQVGNLRSKREWTIYLLLAVFAFAALECFWAWRCGRAG